MDHDLERQLAENASARRRRDKLVADEAEAVRQLEAARAVGARWDSEVRGASQKLEDLDSWSLAYFFATFFGDRQGRIEDEQERLVKLKLQRDVAQQEAAALEQKLFEMREELQGLQDVDARREQLLVARGDDAARELTEAAERLGVVMGQRKEVAEALSYGKLVMAHFDAALDDLRGARSWGRFDIVGGGLIATWSKHSSIDEARQHIHDAQVTLTHFVRELRDTDLSLPDLDVDIGSFATFADYFFDGLISDFFVQGRIVQALERAQEARRRVHQVAHELWKRGEALDEERQQLERRRAELLEG